MLQLETKLLSTVMTWSKVRILRAAFNRNFPAGLKDACGDWQILGVPALCQMLSGTERINSQSLFLMLTITIKTITFNVNDIFNVFGVFFRVIPCLHQIIDTNVTLLHSVLSADFRPHLDVQGPSTAVICFTVTADVWLLW